jgi:hypothetical protein
MLFLPPSDIKRLSLSLQMFSLYFYSSILLPDSLSLSLIFGFKALNSIETETGHRGLNL